MLKFIQTAVALFIVFTSVGQLTLTADFSCAVNSSPTEVRITGPFWGWDPAGGPVATDNGDGTWSVVLDPAPAVDMEYLWINDGVQENLIQSMVDGGSCAPITDFANYANRLWTAGSPDVTDDTYGQCVACGFVPPLTATLDMSCSAVTSPSEVRMTGPFWGWDPVGGPVATDNGDGTWSVVFDPAPAADMEYLWVVDGTQENLIQAMIDGGACAPVTDFATYANRQWLVGGADISDTHDQCVACGGVTSCGDLLNLTFDDASSVTSWLPLADANSPEASISWNATGVTTGALEVSGTNTVDGIGKAYIFQYDNAAMNYNGSTSAQLSFDIKTTAPLTGAAVHLQTVFPGLGAVNNFDLQNQGINDATWTNLVFDYAGIGAGSNFSMHFNIAAGAFIGAGGTLLVDNIQLICTGMVAPSPLTMTLDVCGSNPSEVRFTGPFWGWDPVGGPIATDNGDGTWSVVLDPAPTANMEYLWIVDGVQENLIQDMIDGGSCAPVTDFANYANREWAVGSSDVSDTFDSCGACPGGGCTDVNAANYDAAATFDDGTCAYNVTFQVDMNEYLDPFTTVYVAGSYNGWCADCNPMEDPDLDGVWTATYVVPNGDYQFKYQLDMWAADEPLVAGQSCVQSNGGFINRSLYVDGADQTFDVVCWASCYPCQGGEVPGCNNPNANNYDAAATANDGSCLFDVTFQVDMQQYGLAFTDVHLNGTFNGWCGDCAPMTDLDLDNIYELTIEVQEGYYEYKYTTDNFTDEEIFDGTEGCTVENFGFSNRYVQITDDATLPVVCWNSCAACDIVNTPGCTDANAVNYNAAATTDDGSCLYNVTLKVNMNQYVDPFTTVYVSGTFNGWSGVANPMADPDLNGIWEAVVQMPAGDQEYKFTIDDWAVQENFIGGESCTITIGGFTNRLVSVTDNVVTSTVCWQSCINCTTGQSTVTFRVDMSNEVVDANGVQLVGSFQGWDPLATPMTYMGYGIYEYTIILNQGETIQFKYLNGIDFAMAEIVPMECGLDDGFGSFNRVHTVGAVDETLLVCFAECAACAGCTDPLSAEYNPFAGTDDGSCATPLAYGCTYPDATNYNGAATNDDGSCMFMLGSDCPEDLNNDGLVNASDLLQFLGAFGSTCL